jgi:hypothetical protein
MPMIDVPVTMEWSPEVLERLPEDFRYEVSEGKLVLALRPQTPEHSDISFRVLRLEPVDSQDAVVYQFRLTGHRRYVETRVVMLSTLEKEAGGS